MKRQTPMRRSLSRRATILGAERLPMAMLVMMSAILVFSGMTKVTTLLGILMFFTGIWGLRTMYKSHPQMSQVAPRAFRYQKVYSARLTYPAPWPHRKIIEDLHKQI